MTLLGIELSDAGIMVAAGDPPRLLAVDGQLQESPGFALQEKGQLLVGKAAENKSRLYPRQVNNRFWDQLNTDALEQNGFMGKNNAEIAFAHLAQIWETVNKHGDEVVLAVPGYWSRNQLGFVLGMANELAMPVRGFVNLAVAASTTASPGRMLLCLDIHLHRVEITLLRQDDELSLEETVAPAGTGLDYIHKQWVEAIAAEFVRTTRFDPLHQAVTEQDLYSRLPQVAADLGRRPDVIFGINRENLILSTSLSRDLFDPPIHLVFEELHQGIERLRKKYAAGDTLTTLQLTHRVAGVTGLAERLAQIPKTQVLGLKPGAGAVGALRCWTRLRNRGKIGPEASYYSSCPRSDVDAGQLVADQRRTPVKKAPTHVLYGDQAFPLSAGPLYIHPNAAGILIALHRQHPNSGDRAPLCSIQRQADEIILTDYGRAEIFVEDRRVDGSIALHLGQRIRFDPGEQTIRLIACVKSHET